jgi:hypothetical protein
MHPFQLGIRPPGPVKWCHQCGARHKARDCQLVPVAREAKSGKMVQRFTREELDI